MMERIRQMNPTTIKNKRPSFATTLLILSVMLFSPTSASPRRSVPFTATNESAFRTSDNSNTQYARMKQNNKQSHKSKKLSLQREYSDDKISNFANHRRNQTNLNNDANTMESFSKRISKRDSNLIDDYSSSGTNSNCSNNLLRIPLSLVLQHDSSSGKTTEMKTLLDTGAQVTIMTFQAAKRAGIAHLIDTRYAGHASGVAGVSCRVLGRIPARTVAFMIDGEDGNPHAIDNTPAITILEDKILGGGNHNGIDMLIGLDVLEEWKATLCLSGRTLTVRNVNAGSRQSIVIPLLSKRHNVSPMKSSSQYANSNKEPHQTSVAQSINKANIDPDNRSYNKKRSVEDSLYSTLEEEVVLSIDEEDDEYSDKYFFIESEDDIDECDLSGV